LAYYSRQDKEWDITKVEMRQNPRNKYERNREVNIKKPFEREFPCLPPEIAEGDVYNQSQRKDSQGGNGFGV
jgi:hypothetical protein